jgi:hypothetical protein
MRHCGVSPGEQAKGLRQLGGRASGQSPPRMAVTILIEAICHLPSCCK